MTIRRPGLLLACVLVTACGPTRATPTTAPTTPVTIITTELQQTWASAASPSPEDLVALQGALAAHGLVLIRPTTELAGTDDPGADVAVVVGAPGGRTTADLTVRDHDLAVVVSLQTTTVGSQPACEDRFATGWEPVEVRGTEGCGLIVPGAVSSVDWMESGQWFHVEFGPDRAFGDVVSWLGAWVEV